MCLTYFLIAFLIYRITNGFVGMCHKMRYSISYFSLWIPIITLVNALMLDYSKSGLTKVPPAPEAEVTELNLRDNRIEELHSHSFMNYSELSILDVSSNSLKVIHDGTFDPIYELRIIRLTGNEIRKLPSDFGPSTTTLTSMDVNSGGFDNPDILTYPYFAAFTGLIRISIVSNDIKIHNGSVLPPKTRYLYMKRNNMDTFPHLSLYTPNLERLWIGYNDISTVPQADIDDLIMLRLFHANDNKIIHFPNFSHCLKLEEIYMYRNTLTNIPREHIIGLVSIIHMNLMLNSITVMPQISNLITLETINIGFNQISELPEQYIYGLLNLKVLDCQSNKISVLPNISRLFPHLEELYVQGNRLTTLPDLYDMTPQFRLNAADNPYVCNQSLCWLRMLPWMRPSVNMLQDHARCDEPRDNAGTLVARYHPATMECYRGMDVMSV